MKLAVDTNVLVRAVVQDDAAQGRTAAALLMEADVIAVATPCLCELVWVLRKVYGFAAVDVADAIRVLLGVANVRVDRPAVDAGLAMLDAGGDFADGAIAYQGRWLGGDTFVTFDRKAMRLLKAQGMPARLL